MSLNDLSDLGQFISSLAVLASLIYVAVQIRQTERNQRAMILQGRASRIAQTSMSLTDPQLATVFEKVSAGVGEISESDFAQFRLMFRAVAVSGEDSFLQRKQKLMDDDAFDGQIKAMRYAFRQPGLRAMWRLTRPGYGGEFAIFMDGLLKDVPIDLEPPSDYLARWKALVDEEKAG